MKKIVCVILPTFNGEKYFLQQINSIISQEMPADWNLKILIADDGSTDSTIEVIKEKENQESNIIKFVTFQDKNLGPRRIFEKLGELSLELNPDLLLFSDQDDFWLPGKIQKTIKLMSNVNTTAVYLGSAMITDVDLIPLTKIPKHNLRPEFPSILLSNQRPGMTMALNRKALSESKMGDKHHNSKQVHQYDLNGTYIRTFGSCGEAGRHLGKKHGNKISGCARGKYKKAYNFKWSYVML